MLTFSEEETEPQEFSRREALREVGVRDCLRADTNHGGGGSDQFPTKDSWNKQILQQHRHLVTVSLAVLGEEATRGGKLLEENFSVWSLMAMLMGTVMVFHIRAFSQSIP